MRKILLISAGLFHPPLFARRALRQALEKLEGYEIQHARSMEKLPKALGDFSAIVIYIHHKKISETALEALYHFVSNGGGVLGLHSASASFKEQEGYFKIIGGKFAGHGPVELLEIKPCAHQEIFAGIPAFKVNDELYMHELQPGVVTHFTAMVQGHEIPAVWTYQFGKGRVCYAVPGHRTASLKNATYQKILQRGLAWVCAE